MGFKYTWGEGVDANWVLDKNGGGLDTNRF